jgi:hypothetical protein
MWNENNQNLGMFSRFRKWQNTCASEIKRYIALILAMGIISQSDINEFIIQINIYISSGSKPSNLSSFSLSLSANIS